MRDPENFAGREVRQTYQDGRPCHVRPLLPARFRRSAFSGNSMGRISNRVMDISIYAKNWGVHPPNNAIGETPLA